MDSIRIYLHIIKVPASASFWEKYEYAFGSGSVDIFKAYVLAYVSSTVRSIRSKIARVRFLIPTRQLHGTKSSKLLSYDLETSWTTKGQDIVGSSRSVCEMLLGRQSSTRELVHWKRFSESTAEKRLDEEVRLAFERG